MAPQSILSIGSTNSVLSLWSANSVLSIGSVGSALSIFSVGSFLSVASAFSSFSLGSVLSYGSCLSLLSAKAVKKVKNQPFLYVGMKVGGQAKNNTNKELKVSCIPNRYQAKHSCYALTMTPTWKYLPQQN